jgi:hypothetical protein
MKLNAPRLIGWPAAGVSIATPLIWLSGSTPKFFTQTVASSEVVNIAIWTIALVGSVVAAKLLNRSWYLLTGFWVLAFSVISAVMLTGDFRP